MQHLPQGRIALWQKLQSTTDRPVWDMWRSIWNQYLIFPTNVKTYYCFLGLLWWYSFSFSCKNIISGQIAYDIYPQLPIIAKKSFTEISPVTCVIDTLYGQKHGTRFNGGSFSYPQLGVTHFAGILLMYLNRHQQRRIYFFWMMYYVMFEMGLLRGNKSWFLTASGFACLSPTFFETPWERAGLYSLKHVMMKCNDGSKSPQPVQNGYM